jgi:uncharacterized protein (TIGR03435 family)
VHGALSDFARRSGDTEEIFNRMRTLTTTLLFAAATAAFAQNPAFDVASIKPADPQADGRIMIKMGGDPGRLDYVNVSIRDLIRQAFGVQDYQVNGPDWMVNERFNLQAKYPPDTSREAVNQMLQALLTERFGLKIHKDSKELAIFDLILAKNGSKLKESEAISSTSGPSDATSPRPTAPTPITMRLEGADRLHLSGTAVPIARFADLIGRQVGKPVFDKTGLAGKYDIELEFKPEQGVGVMRIAGAMPGHDGSSDSSDATPAPSIFNALQEQLGLKLESKKGPVETIVVDQVSKTPTEN